MRPTFDPCCGEEVTRIREDYDIVRRLDGMLIVLVGIHHIGRVGLTQCVMCATTRRRFDVPWQPFWQGVSDGTIPDASEMETIAVWAHLGRTGHVEEEPEPLQGRSS